MMRSLFHVISCLAAADALQHAGPLRPLRRVHAQTAPTLPRMNLLEPAELTAPPEKVVAAVETAQKQQPSGTRLTAADLASASGIGIDDARLAHLAVVPQLLAARARTQPMQVEQDQ